VILYLHPGVNACAVHVFICICTQIRAFYVDVCTACGCICICVWVYALCVDSFASVCECMHCVKTSASVCKTMHCVWMHLHLCGRNCICVSSCFLVCFLAVTDLHAAILYAHSQAVRGNACSCSCMPRSCAVCDCICIWV
jgi:hypothetical protein